MNYFEMLDIPESETSEQAISAAYQQARVKWQTLLNQAIGEEQQLAREVMGGGLETAYATLIDPARRQQYVRELKLTQASSTPAGQGNVRVSFSLSNGHVDHDFVVVENPVRHALETDGGLAISSIQEYVCRVWEDFALGRGHIADRTLERWLYYAAGEAALASALGFLRWAPDAPGIDNQLSMALDLLQGKYSVPILPRHDEGLAERLALGQTPQWRITPAVVHFGLLRDHARATETLAVKSWGEKLGSIEATAQHPALQLDTSALVRGRLNVSVDETVLARGEHLQTTLVLESKRYGRLEVPVIGARVKGIFGDGPLVEWTNRTAGAAAMARADYGMALDCFRRVGDNAAVMAAEKALVRRAYDRHDWTGVMALGRSYKDECGYDVDVQRWLVEALTMVAGSIFQLGEHRRALEYLAALACEAAGLPRGRLRKDSWIAQPEAQLRLNLQDPKADWVDATEAYGLNWTHASGRADGSHYAGEVPLNVAGRRVFWRTREEVRLVPPLIAYEGILVARAKEKQGLVALDAASGRQAWMRTWDTLAGQGAAPVAGEGLCFGADPAGRLFALHIQSGKEVWSTQLEDSHDVRLAYGDGILCVATGKRLTIFVATNGEQLAATDEMKTFFGWMNANPINLLITDHCCLFQKVGGVDHSMVFLDMAQGSYLEFAMPVARKWVSSLLGSAIAGSKWTQITWAAYAGEIYVPLLVTMQLECKTQYRDRDGKVRTKVERESWGELHFFVYQPRHKEIVAHMQQVIWGTAYEENKACSISVQEVRAANACAVAPAYVRNTDGTDVVSLPQEGKPLYRLVAAGFGRDVYYWISTDRHVKRSGYRRAEGDVRAIAYLGLYDLVITADTLSTSFLGNTAGKDASRYRLPLTIDGLAGSPAFYGDVIYLTTRSGEVVALGR